MANTSKYKIGDEITNSNGNILKYLGDTGKRNPSTDGVIGSWQCYCGNSFETMNANILIKTQSCSCLNRRVIDNKMNKAKENKNQENFKYLYSLHNTIKQKCFNKNTAAYKNYGAKGIPMHELWVEDADKFVEDIIINPGHRPAENYICDLIDSVKGFMPGNLKWVEVSAKTPTNKKMFSIQIIIDILEKNEQGYSMNKLSKEEKIDRKEITDLIYRRGKYTNVPSLEELRQQLSSKPINNSELK